MSAEDDDVVAGLRHALHEVARATPTAAGRDAGRAALLAVLDERDAVAPMAEGTDDAVATRSRAGWPRGLAVAAAVVVVGLVALLVAGRTGGDGVERAGDDGTGGVDLPAAGLAGPVDDPDLATGWYLPGPGWTITEVRIDFLDVGEEGVCPCRAWTAARPGDGTPSVLDLAETAIPGPDGDPPDPSPAEVDVGGRTARRAQWGAGTETLWVDTGGRRISVTSRAVPDEAVEAVVGAWADAVDAGRTIEPAALPLPAGYVGSGVQHKEGVFEHLVAVTAEQAGTGHRVQYQLVPTGYLRSLLTSATTVADAGGAFAFVTGAPASGSGEGMLVGAIGGPVDVTAGAPSDLDRDALEAFLASLREVDAETWRAALPDGDVDDAVRTAATIFAPPLTG